MCLAHPYPAWAPSPSPGGTTWHSPPALVALDDGTLGGTKPFGSHRLQPCWAARWGMCPPLLHSLRDRVTNAGLCRLQLGRPSCSSHLAPCTLGVDDLAPSPLPYPQRQYKQRGTRCRAQAKRLSAPPLSLRASHVSGTLYINRRDRLQCGYGVRGMRSCCWYPAA